jgi:hypothetical protein
MTLIPSEGGDPQFSVVVPIEIRYGDSTNVAIKFSLASDRSKNGSLFALEQALGLGRDGIGSTMVAAGDPTLSKNHFVIIVEEK